MTAPRTYCIECRTKLPAGECIESTHGFCTRGCWERWHRRHCAARGCGEPMPRKRAGGPVQYCGRRCRASAQRFPPLLWPDSPRKTRTPVPGPKCAGLGAGKPHETGSFLPLDSDRPGGQVCRCAWVRQGPEHLCIDRDGTVIARVFPESSKWRPAVPGLRVIGPLAAPFDTVVEAKSAATTVLLVACSDDARTRAIMRRIGRSAPSVPKPKEADQARGATKQWIVSFQQPRSRSSPSPTTRSLDLPAFLDRRAIPVECVS
jgi:hypothetical protein